MLWTLSVEVAFYVVLPLIALGFLRRPVLWLAGGARGDGGAARAGAGPRRTRRTSDRLLSLPPMFAADFAAGMAGAWLYARGVRLRAGWRRPRSPPRSAVLWASGGADAGAARLGARQSLWLAVAVPVAFGALVLAAAAGPRALAARWPTTAPRAGSGRCPSASSSFTSW